MKKFGSVPSSRSKQEGGIRRAYPAFRDIRRRWGRGRAGVALCVMGQSPFSSLFSIGKVVARMYFYLSKTIWATSPSPLISYPADSRCAARCCGEAALPGSAARIQLPAWCCSDRRHDAARHGAVAAAGKSLSAAGTRHRATHRNRRARRYRQHSIFRWRATKYRSTRRPDRLIAAVELHRRYPGLRIVFSGGNSNLIFRGRSESRISVPFLEDLGYPATNQVDDGARNTMENAVNAKKIAYPKPGERWLLVTSASHMPRAIGLFQAAGFPVEAYPVDYRTGGWRDVRTLPSLPCSVGSIGWIPQSMNGRV